MFPALLKQAKFRRNGCPLCLVLSSAKFIFLAKKGNSTWSISAPSTSSSSWGWAHQQVSSAVVTSVSTVDAGQGKSTFHHLCTSPLAFALVEHSSIILST